MGNQPAALEAMNQRKGPDMSRRERTEDDSGS